MMAQLVSDAESTGRTEAHRHTCEGAVKGEAVHVPQLDRLVNCCRGQLPGIWAQQALQNGLAWCSHPTHRRFLEFRETRIDFIGESCSDAHIRACLGYVRLGCLKRSIGILETQVYSFSEYRGPTDTEQYGKRYTWLHA